MVLYTTGYQHDKSLDTFVPKLTAAGVALVVDVRIRAASRFKPDFNRDRLRRGLAAAGIGYLHLRGLGNPDRVTDWAVDPAGATGYAAHLDADDDAELDMLALAAIARCGAACLLCLEADAAECHRSVIAERIARRLPGLAVVHLG